jgi:hypothetical protein
MAIANSFNPLRSPDFNGDGKTDALWFNRATGQTEFWIMDGVTRTQSSNPITVTGGWTQPLVGDFNGDDKTDLFWQNAVTGENSVWLVDGINAPQTLLIPSLDRSFQAQIGDFNGDRKADLYWHNSQTGANQIWLMDGATRLQEVILPTIPGWEPKLAEFNLDNKSDIFWRKTETGENGVWLMDGGSVINYSFVRSQPISWSSQLLDYTGDGRSDAVWQDSATGNIVIWEWSTDPLQPTNIDYQFPSQGRDGIYRFGDFGGDGRADTLVRDPSTGTTRLFINEGSTLKQYDFATLPSSWQPYLSDFNGDNKADIVWHDSNTGASLTWRLQDQRIAELNVLPERSVSQQWVPTW